jgi:enoyl-CoA hydratase/carnithine racemase
MKSDELMVSEDNGVLIATLNRPDKLNALNNALMAALHEAVLHFRDTPSLKVMLIRATGRYFCAGADLHEGDPNATPRTARGIREQHRVRNRNMQSLWDEIEHIEKPFVAAHHAMCVGGGLELSLSCDFRLATASAGYSFPEGKFGILPASNGVSRLTRLCGPHWARYMIMANRKVTAERALIMGLVHEVFPDETFEEDVLSFCHDLARQNEEQMGAAKIAIEMVHEVGRDTARHVERMANSALMLNPDYLEGIRRHIAGIGAAPRADR